MTGVGAGCTATCDRRQHRPLPDQVSSNYTTPNTIASSNAARNCTIDVRCVPPEHPAGVGRGAAALRAVLAGVPAAAAGSMYVCTRWSIPRGHPDWREDMICQFGCSTSINEESYWPGCCSSRWFRHVSAGLGVHRGGGGRRGAGPGRRGHLRVRRPGARTLRSLRAAGTLHAVSVLYKCIIMKYSLV